MKELENFTVERLEEIILRKEPYDINPDDIDALAKIALAVKGNKPVGVSDGTTSGYGYTRIKCYFRKEIPVGDFVYLVPPPQPENNWIKCSDKLPQFNVEVLATSKSDGIFFFQTSDKDSYKNGLKEYMSLLGITHWQPLPEPPKDK